MKKQLGRKAVAMGTVLALILLISLDSNAQAQTSPPAKFEFLVGEWEARIPTNHYRMRVEWDKGRNQFRGFLTKQGEVSAMVGFRIGEHVWTAQPIGEPDVLIELQKFRSGSSGASTNVEWKVGKVDMEQSSANALVASFVEFSKVK